jgi:signal transduction histidine kinase
LLNLLSNAIKFTDRGEVTLLAERRADDSLQLQVCDTGIGIAAADLQTLFQPFKQVESGLARRHEGTGLGLAISRRLTELMGGQIAAVSEWGQGSTFTVTLPIRSTARQ